MYAFAKTVKRNEYTLRCCKNKRLICGNALGLKQKKLKM